MKKEDIIRHFKWHKKRSDSLQHGFMRFSPMEDCSQKFHQAACIHNGKHTHYHCLQVRFATTLIRQSDGIIITVLLSFSGRSTII